MRERAIPHTQNQGMILLKGIFKGAKRGSSRRGAFQSMSRKANQNWRNLRYHDVLIDMFFEGAELILQT